MKFAASSLFMTLNGVILMGLGFYFILIRPPLLSEDLRFMDISYAIIQNTLPGLTIWLRHVFWVLGGYMLTSGLLTSYVALTEFRKYSNAALLVICMSNLGSIGWMAVVNFMIDSDFKWLLLSFNLPWILSIFLFSVEKRKRNIV